jgi:hypothetical protein
MNVRIEYPAEFLAAVYWENKVIFNCYHVRCEMITDTKDHVEQNIALERLKFMIFNQFHNCVFVDAREKAAIKRLEAAGIKTVALPELPVDQIVGMMLYSKLDAVMEGRIAMIQLRVSSDLGENVIYSHNEQETIGPLNQKGWWNEADPACSDPRSGGKVVSINERLTWQSVDLDWAVKEDNTEKNVITLFKKDDKE